LECEGIESYVVLRHRLRHRVGAVVQRPTKSMAKRSCAHCWPTNEASHASVRWSGRPASRRKIGGASAVSVGTVRISVCGPA
jgi:hypothetical protein